MKKYIFITMEGFTYQPIANIGDDAEEIENCQVIGFSEGKDPDEAFRNLILNNPYLKETSFDHIYCYQLDTNYSKTRADFYLSDEYQKI